MVVTVMASSLVCTGGRNDTGRQAGRQVGVSVVVARAELWSRQAVSMRTPLEQPGAHSPARQTGGSPRRPGPRGSRARRSGSWGPCSRSGGSCSRGPAGGERVTQRRRQCRAVSMCGGAVCPQPLCCLPRPALRPARHSGRGKLPPEPSRTHIDGLLSQGQAGAAEQQDGRPGGGTLHALHCGFPATCGGPGQARTGGEWAAGAFNRPNRMTNHPQLVQAEGSCRQQGGGRAGNPIAGQCGLGGPRGRPGAPSEAPDRGAGPHRCASSSGLTALDCRRCEVCVDWLRPGAQAGDEGHRTTRTTQWKAGCPAGKNRWRSPAEPRFGSAAASAASFPSPVSREPNAGLLHRGPPPSSNSPPLTSLLPPAERYR